MKNKNLITKFRLKKEFHVSVRNLFHDDYANKIIHMKEGQDFFIDRGFPLDKIEKVQEITPTEELLNVLSMKILLFIMFVFAIGFLTGYVTCENKHKYDKNKTEKNTKLSTTHL